MGLCVGTFCIGSALERMGEVSLVDESRRKRSMPWRRELRFVSMEKVAVRMRVLEGEDSVLCFQSSHSGPYTQ